MNQGNPVAYKENERGAMAGARIFLFLVLIAFSAFAAGDNQVATRGSERGHTGQSTKEPDHPENTPHESGDPLGRNTPHGTLLGFLHAAQTGNYKGAAEYLQLSNIERTEEGETVALKLQELMDQAFVGRIGAVSDNPEGSPQPGVPHDTERIGVFRTGYDNANVDLVRVSDPYSGENIWLFSSSTLASASKLSEQLEQNTLESKLPRFLVDERILSTPLWRWIAFLLLIPLAYLLSSVVVALVRGGLRLRLRKHPSPLLQDVRESINAPAKLVLTVAFHWTAVTSLGLALLLREYYRRIAGVALAASLAWFIVGLINRWAERARLNALADAGYRTGTIILLGQRILTAVIVVVAGLVTLSIFGFELTTVIAGLGIGSVAIAFAAQKTLENLLGGISILGDQVIRVGETCRIGETVGTVEDISLRSTRIRTLDSTQMSVPNGQLADMNIENLSRIDRSSFRTTIALQRQTSPGQLRSLLEEMRELLLADPKVDSDLVRVHLSEFGESSLDIEVFCRILTGNRDEFLDIRERLLLQFMDLVAEAGTQLALPAHTLHVTHNESSAKIDMQRRNKIS